MLKCILIHALFSYGQQDQDTASCVNTHHLTCLTHNIQIKTLQADDYAQAGMIASVVSFCSFLHPL